MFDKRVQSLKNTYCGKQPTTMREVNKLSDRVFSVPEREGILFR